LVGGGGGTVMVIVVVLLVISGGHPSSAKAAATALMNIKLKIAQVNPGVFDVFIGNGCYLVPFITGRHCPHLLLTRIDCNSARR